MLQAETFALSVAVKASAVLAVACLTAAAMRRRSPAARHLVWTAAAGAVVALPFLSAGLPEMGVASGAESTGALAVLFRVAAIEAPAAGQPADVWTGGAAAPAGFPWRTVPLVLWIGGIAVGAIRLAMAIAGLRSIGGRTAGGALQDLTSGLARELGIGRRVAVRVTGDAWMPVACGVLRPVVMVPEEAERWPAGRLRLVLLHELAHIARGDQASQMLMRAAAIFYWWNPLMWWAAREFLNERERAADDVVLGTGAKASEYAGHLVQLARTLAPPQFEMAAVAAVRRSQLESRVMAILDGGRDRTGVGRKGLIAAVAAAVAIIAPLASVRAQSRAVEEVPDFESARQRVEFLAETTGRKGVEYGVAVRRMADAEARRKGEKEAQALYRIAVQVLGDRKEAAPALIGLGLTTKGDPQELIGYFQKAQSLDPLQAGPALMWTAVLRERENEDGEAESLYKSALAVAEPDSLLAADICQLYARLLQRNSRLEEGKAMADRAAKIRKEYYEWVQPVVQSTAVRVGGGVTAPQIELSVPNSKVEPRYTPEARFAKYQGTAVVSVEVGADGLPHNLRILKGLGFGLDEMALAAIRQWRFRPGMRDGQPVNVAATIEVNFRLL